MTQNPSPTGQGSYPTGGGRPQAGTRQSGNTPPLMNLHPPETKPPRSGGPLPTWMPNSASDIVDETYTLLDQIPGLTAFKTITYPTKDDELPAVCVAFGPERADAEGQWNQQQPHFLHVFTLFVSIVDKQDMHTSDLEELDEDARQRSQEIAAQLQSMDQYVRRH